MKNKYTTKLNFEVIASSKISSKVKESLASVDSVAPFFSDVDLLPVAFNAAVINEFNKNDDGIDIQTIAPHLRKFTHKPINIEHDRRFVIGHSVVAEIMDQENKDILSYDWENLDESRKMNLTLGGFIYKMVDVDFYQRLEASMDKNSENYQSISASWEIGFNSYAIAVGEGDFQDLEFFYDPVWVAEKSKYLIPFGGDGYDENGKRVRRLITGNITPLGIGFVENPAANVKGIYKGKESLKEDVGMPAAASTSQNTNNNVKSFDTQETMNLQEIIQKALASEQVSEHSSANLAKQIAESIKEKNEDYKNQLEEKEREAVEEKKKKEELEAAVEKMKEDLKSAQEKISQFEQEKESQAFDAKLNERMEYLDNIYAFENEHRKVILEDLKSLNVHSDEDFNAYASKLEVLFKDRNKEVLAAKEKASKEAFEKAVAERLNKQSESQASESNNDEEDTESALENTENSNANITNNNQGSQEGQSLVERMKNAFSKDNVKIS